MSGGLDKSGLFGRGDAGGSAAVVIAFTHPDFDEHECVAILHDQVYFSKATAIVSR